MKIAITSAGTDLNSNVDPRFGRTPYFLIVDTDTMQFEAIENPNVNAMGGAGIQSAQLVANKGVEVVLTGSCGPNAFQTLQAAGTKVITGVVGTVSEAIERYKSGQLNPITGPNVGSHYGMGYGTSQGPGFPQPNPEQELQMLKQQANYLKQQLETISKRIKELENKK